MTVRQRFVVLHRYVGLVMAGFLIIAGLTGALLVWYYELDALINPQWLQVEPPAAHSEPLSPFALRDQVAPPTINLDNPDEGCDLDYVAHQAQARPLEVVVSNSFGFGGSNCSLILGAGA